jgi:sugar/nucleoside kinase (ribokinase family)
MLVLGEALVDLVCERPVRDMTEATAFTPHFGGAAANVAVAAARAGGDVALLGGAGDDPWGRWLRARLEEEGVSTRWFELAADRQTPIAFATVSPEGEPAFAIYGEGISAAIVAAEDRLEAALAAEETLVYSSNALFGPERAVTLRARGLARRAIFDPNLRLERWADRDEALAIAGDQLAGCEIVKCNAAEARLLSGEDEPARAAEAIAERGVAAVVVTLGADGALVRGAERFEVPGRPARVVSAIGAGDAFLGTLVARLGAGLRPAVQDAVEAGARATETWGAVA